MGSGKGAGVGGGEGSGKHRPRRRRLAGQWAPVRSVWMTVRLAGAARAAREQPAGGAGPLSPEDALWVGCGSWPGDSPSPGEGACWGRSWNKDTLLSSGPSGTGPPLFCAVWMDYANAMFHLIGCGGVADQLTYNRVILNMLPKPLLRTQSTLMSTHIFSCSQQSLNLPTSHARGVRTGPRPAGPGGS